MKRPTKKQVQYLQISLGMTGAIAVNDCAADLILTVQNEMKRLKGKFSISHAVDIKYAVEETYKKKESKK